jgi:ABC-type dipeptide/oligopeptide/nickel transport system permease subunit
MLKDIGLSIRRPRFSRSRRGVAGLAILLSIALGALGADWLTPDSPYAQHLIERRHSPSIRHPLGQDELGRDNLSRVLHGARLSLRVGVSAALIALAAGGLLGVLAGALGGWPDSLIMSLTDAVLAFPALLLALSLIMSLGRGLTSAAVAVGLAAVPVFVRLARIGVIRARQQDYVLAARAVGVPPGRLLLRHILPDIAPPLLVQTMLFIGTAILEVAGLSFLGLGAQPPAPEWGAMIAQGRGAVFAAPHIVIFPGLAIMLTVLGFNLLGDGLRDVLDPRAAL